MVRNKVESAEVRVDSAACASLISEVVSDIAPQVKPRCTAATSVLWLHDVCMLAHIPMMSIASSRVRVPAVASAPTAVTVVVLPASNRFCVVVDTTSCAHLLCAQRVTDTDVIGVGACACLFLWKGIFKLGAAGEVWWKMFFHVVRRLSTVARAFGSRCNMDSTDGARIPSLNCVSVVRLSSQGKSFVPISFGMISVPSAYGGIPVSSVHAMIPSAHTSPAPDTTSVRCFATMVLASSGGANWMEKDSGFIDPMGAADAKSTSTHCLVRESRITLLGFTSRCAYPAAWICCSFCVTWRRTCKKWRCECEVRVACLFNLIIKLQNVWLPFQQKRPQNASIQEEVIYL